MAEASILVNAHTHLEQTWLAPYCPDVNGVTFTNWIVETLGTAKRAVGDRRETAIREGIEAGIQMLLDSGTTSVGDISSTGWSIPPLMESGLSGVIWAEVIATSPQQGEEQFARALALIEEWRPRERNGMRIGLTLHAPYSLLPAYWQRGLEYARKENLPLCIHAAESDEEYEWFMHGTGPVGETNRRLQMDFRSPGVSPIHYMEDSGALDLKPLLVHVVHVDDADIERIRRSGCPVVHCPRSNLRLRCGRMPLEKFLAAGIEVYMGTDSLGSSPSLDVRDEVEIAVALHWGKVAPTEIMALAHKPMV
jgi:aminodeoxyfutalosine deaminase